MYLVCIVFLFLAVFPLLKPSCSVLPFHPFTKDVALPFKGLLALLVVIHHISQYSYIGILSPFREIGWLVVACFLFISGYGLLNAILIQGQGYLKDFFSKRLLKIIFPYVLCILVFQLLYGLDGHAICFSSILNDLIWKGETPLPFSWYIIVILVFYVAFYLIFRIVRDVKWGIRGMFIFSVAFILFTDLIMHYGNWWYISTFAFNTGMLFKYKEKGIIRIYKNHCRKLFGGLILFIIFMGVMRHFKESSFIVAAFFPAVCVLFLYYYPLVCNRILKFLGSISYEIYLVQAIPIFFLRGNHIVIPYGILYVAGALGLTIGLAWLFSTRGRG